MTHELYKAIYESYYIFITITYLFINLASSCIWLTWTLSTLTCMLEQHWDAHTLTLTTLTSLLPQLWSACSYNTDMFTFTIGIQVALSTLTYLLLKLWHACSQYSDMLTVTNLTIWVHWKQAGTCGYGLASCSASGFAGSSGYGFAGSGHSGFAGSSGTGFAAMGETDITGSKLVPGDMASLEAVNLDFP